MHRSLATLIVALLASGALVACGGGEEGGSEEAAGQQETAAQRQTGQAEGAGETGGQEGAGEDQVGLPGWMEVSDSDRTVTLEVVAARTTANNNWNFNGYAGGDATITVPQGYEVTIDFSNEDPAVVHSLGIDEKPDRWSATFRDPQPVFEGAITSNPTSMSRATAPGASETITFTADQAGEYAMVCYVPGHAVAGMWIWFHVSADGSAGFATSGS